MGTGEGEEGKGKGTGTLRPGPSRTKESMEARPGAMAAMF